MTSPKPFLILQLRPEDDTADSEYAAILHYGNLNNLPVHRIRVEKQALPPINLDDYAAIIVGGSPFDVSAKHKSALQRRIERDFHALLEKIVAEDFPFLGCCSGCGLLGSYLGTPISNKYGEPVSEVTVFLTPSAKNDPLLSGFPKQISVLLGHKEACDETPQGATLLIEGNACPVQMFRVGENVYATQFHPEGDGEGFAVRIQAYKNHGYFDPETAEQLTRTLARADTSYAQRLLRRFVQRYRR